MIKYADIVIGLSFGDEGKGKVTNSLLKSGNYTHCIRFNGGHNAGHTIYKDGKKYVSHIIPTGLFQNVTSIIGPGCVTSARLLEEELQPLIKAGFQTKGKLFIDKRVNLVSYEHVYEDSRDEKIGTTKKGNGPAYRDKYARKNVRFGDLPWNDPNYDVCDIYEELHNNQDNKVLMEGAQAFGLDIDWGDYPYVTSSHCGVGSAIQNGIPFNKVRHVYGVCKAYDTYVGKKNFEGTDPVFSKIRELGQEFGATTGRPRQIDFLDLDFLVKSATINGVTDLIVNKMDVLEKANVWKLKLNGKLETCADKKQFIQTITSVMTQKTESVNRITYSESPEDI